MRSLLIGLCALSLAGCATVSSTSVSVNEAQALYVAEAAFDGATLAVEQAVKTGALTGANAATANTYLTEAHTALLAAEAAYAAGNATTMAAQIASVTTLVVQIETLTKGA